MSRKSSLRRKRQRRATTALNVAIAFAYVSAAMVIATGLIAFGSTL